MKRIVIFLGSQGHGSGAERVLEYLLEGALSRREEICLLSPSSSSVTKFARERGYEWIPWEADDDALVQNTRAFWRLIHGTGKRFEGSLVHSWHTRHLEWACALGKCWQCPSAGTLHDDPSPAHHQFGRSRKTIIRLAAAHLDGIVAVSDAVTQRCRALGWKCGITTIRNGLPDALPAPFSSAPPLRLGFMATTVLWKGLGLLPELVRRTSDLPLEWNLFGARQAETNPLLEQLIRLPRVFYHGRRPLEEALARVDVLLHLSLALDPYPTVLLEAARAGLASIASRTGGTAEIVVDGHTGLLVPPEDIDAVEAAIRRLLADPSLRQKMGTAARQRFEESFRVERMVADYFGFWDRLRSARS